MNLNQPNRFAWKTITEYADSLGKAGRELISPLVDGLEAVIRSKCGVPFRGKWIGCWLRFRDRTRLEVASIAGGGMILCDFSIPYEAMVWLGEEETVELDLLRRLLHPGDTFIDCGSNIGLWTIAAAKAVGPSGVVHSFEPNPSTFARLAENLQLSNIQNVRMHNRALGSHVGSVSMDPLATHNLCHVVEFGGTLDVPLVTLDSILLERVDHVHGIKIDVEGYELEVLRGARRVLANHCPWIVIEFNSEYSGTRRLGKWDVHDELIAYGYEPYAMFPGGVLAIDPDRFALRKMYCNLLYLPKVFSDVAIPGAATGARFGNNRSSSTFGVR